MNGPPPAGEGESISERRAAAFFDLDKTVLAKDAMAAFRGPLYDGGLLTRRSVTRALLAQLVYLILGASERRVERVRELVLRLTVGWERDEVVEIVEEALERIVEPIIYAEAMDLIEEHHREGRLVVIVSASPEEIVGPLGRHLGVDETIASRAAVDNNGYYTGEMAFYAYGPHKADAIREFAVERGIDLDRSYAYSDSAGDLPMLESVGHPVAVNPDRELTKLAREREWGVRNFTRPVRLRDRVRQRVTPQRPVVVISAGAIVVAVAAIGFGWWLGSRRRSAADLESLRL